MKKSLLLTTLTAFGLAGYAQTFVSTSPENRNVVLEEFTGIYCTFCPDGHRLAQELYDNNPNDVVLVNIHTGGFASPDGNDPDFQTSFGAALANQSDLCGYPAGTVNRQYFPQYFQTDNSGNPCGAEPTAQGRGSWQTTGGLILQDASPVNVAGQATLDLSTRKLTVVVEAYYTGNAANPTNKLTVAVLQNGVIGPQTGSSANPDQVNPDGTYSHNHMLRHFLTGQWGASVTPTTAGSFFTDTYVWDIPADVRDVPLILAELEVVVYIAEGNQDVVTGSKVPLTVVSPNAYDALPADIDIPEFVCESEIAPKVTIQNMGNETMTNLEILYSVNGGPASTYNWTGSIATAGQEEVTLPAISFTHQPTNTFWVATQGPNGQGDEVSANDIATQTFQPSKNSGNTVVITITPDNYGSETTWRLRSPSGTVVASGGPYTNNVTTPDVVTVNNLANGCHTFEIDDEYGDGMCCAYGNGSFKLESNGSTLYTGGQFGSSDERVFNVGGTSGINDIELVSNVSVYPNPFKDNATVAFNMVQTGEVVLEVVNVLGAKVISQNLGEKATGAHNINISSANLNSGIYMVNLLVDGTIYSTRVNISK
jgi:thiol-disulfide isomerase/thioredoxin